MESNSKPQNAESEEVKVNFKAEKGEVLVTKPELKSLANKCFTHIIDSKLKIEDEEISSCINDDVLNRFYVAREGNEKKSFSMWSGWLDWRLQYHPDRITPKDIEKEIRSGKAFLHGFDKEGRPCIVVKGCRHIPAKTDMDEFIKFFIYGVEKACKIADEKGVKQIVVIIDRENVGWANVDKRFFGKMNLATILQDYYAERLHKTYILHVNWIFKSVYAMVKPFLSEKTKSKMNIINHMTDLKVDFTEDNLLPEHGGTSTFVYDPEVVLNE